MRLGMDANNEVPALPNELMRMIFRECSDKDRVPFGTSCRRFRMIDVDIGRRTFEEIYVILGKYLHNIKAVNYRLAAAPDYSMKQHGLIGYWWSNHYNNLFKHTKTRLLEVQVNDDETASFALQMLRTTSFHELNIKFTGNLSFSDFAFSLIKDRNLANKNISITWNCIATPENINRMRVKFLEFPKTNILRLYHFNSGKPVHSWVNEENLLHFAANTNILHLGIIKCSAHGILKVFENICDRQENIKSICFETDKTVVDELFSMNQTRFEIGGSPGFLTLVHRISNSILYETYFAGKRMLMTIVMK